MGSQVSETRENSLPAPQSHHSWHCGKKTTLAGGLGRRGSGQTHGAVFDLRSPHGGLHRVGSWPLNLTWRGSHTLTHSLSHTPTHSFSHTHTQMAISSSVPGRGLGRRGEREGGRVRESRERDSRLRALGDLAEERSTVSQLVVQLIYRCTVSCIVVQLHGRVWCCAVAE